MDLYKPQYPVVEFQDAHTQLQHDHICQDCAVSMGWKMSMRIIVFTCEYYLLWIGETNNLNQVIVCRPPIFRTKMSALRTPSPCTPGGPLTPLKPNLV